MADTISRELAVELAALQSRVQDLSEEANAVGERLGELLDQVYGESGRAAADVSDDDSDAFWDVFHIEVEARVPAQRREEMNHRLGLDHDEVTADA